MTETPEESGQIGGMLPAVVDGGQENTEGNSEAAKYRRQLRDAQTQVETLTATVTALRRAEVERVATSMGVSKPASIWLAGLDVDTLLDDTGTIDKNKAFNAIAGIVDTLGLDRTRAVIPNPGQPDCLPSFQGDRLARAISPEK